MRPENLPLETLGLPLYESDVLTVEGPPETRHRSWRERLFGHPWNPLRATETVRNPVPDPSVYVITLPFGKRFMMAHPRTADRVRQALAAHRQTP